MTGRIGFLLMFVLLLVGCSDPKPPVGRWEGAAEHNGVMVVARVQILANGQVRVSAPDILDMQDAKPEQIERMRDQLAADLVTNWDSVEPRDFEFDGTIFRKPKGIAPQMMWDKKTNQMTLQFYFGNNRALPVVLRPVESFHENPWGSA